MQTHRESEQRPRANSDVLQQSNTFGTSLTKFLRGKASKAYEFGEGLVMSITSKDKLTQEQDSIENDPKEVLSIDGSITPATSSF